jgi:hypothetical protein
MATRLQKEKNRISNEIVGLVERTGGLVTIARIHREIPGFAGPPYRDVRSRADRQKIFWTGMTEAGCQALTSVLNGRVALEPTSPLPYLLDGKRGNARSRSG